MCDPITLAGIGLTIGSTAVNTIAASKARKAQNNVLFAERTRQKELDQEAQAKNVESQNEFQDFGNRQNQRAQELGDYFASQKAVPDTVSESVNIPQSASNITLANEGVQRGKAQAFTDQQGQALGNLRSFGDLLGEVSRGNARNASDIGVIGGFKRGSSALTGYELENAARAGDGLKLFGDILGGFGSLATSKGLSGGLGGGGRAAVDPWAGLRF
jgi:hypothetical protein